ncbi:hypothetical protein NLG42_21370 [Flavobacterium plurextorum]|uniref:hypothetical protein n=1 Tax=Flavobacterium TaxID=237 RepID=UPI00214D4020|nr:MULTISPECIES: hypothetical protein [Flavobacterium]UUW08641.1 hypothetical protein NLG42_21370 [Flavobacterium plurextorum]
MKNLLLTGLIIIVCSCSSEDFEKPDLSPASKEAVSMDKKLDFKNEEASEKNFMEVTAGNFILLVPAQIKEKVISVLKEHRTGNYLKTSKKNGSDLDTISCGQDPVAALFVIVDESMLGPSLKIDVKAYVTNLGNLRSQNYEIVDDFIIQYEISKRQDSTLLTNEKEAILNISSISEAVLFSAKDRKDRDWETSTTSKYAGY